MQPQDTQIVLRRRNLLTLRFSLCVKGFVLILSARSELRNVWNDFYFFLKAKWRGNKIISLLLHAHIPDKMITRQ